jgi:predicted flap endonuclease-1-like 5' DNA nuclease
METTGPFCLAGGGNNINKAQRCSKRMSKLLAERKSVLKAGKRKDDGVEFEELNGNANHDSKHVVKRIQWTETREIEQEQPEVRAGIGQEEIIRVREYRPRHHANMNSIQSDIDHIDRRGSAVEPVEFEERTVYETDRSTVRGSRYGSKTTYHLEDQGRLSTRRTLTRSMVDEVIRGVNLDDEVIVREEVVEYEPRIVEEVVPVKKPAKKAVKKPAKAKVVAKPATKKAVKTPAKAAVVAKPAAKKTEQYYDYKGDIHPVIEIEGIGPVYEKKLGAMGIRTSARLCYADAKKIAKKLDTDEKRIISWQQMSELAKVNGIGPQYAEALVRAGISGIKELKARQAAEIAKQTTDYLEGLKNNVLGAKVTPQRVTTWQKHAKPMRRVKQVIPEE